MYQIALNRNQIYWSASRWPRRWADGGQMISGELVHIVGGEITYFSSSDHSPAKEEKENIFIHTETSPQGVGFPPGGH
jgi:hypothetical protein